MRSVFSLDLVIKIIDLVWTWDLVINYIGAEVGTGYDQDRRCATE